MKHITILTAVCLVGLVGCQSTGQQLSNEQQLAIDTSLKSARVDMNCPSASGKVLSKQMVQSTSEGFGVARAEYTVDVEGCGQKKSVMVICPQDGSGCFVGGPHEQAADSKFKSPARAKAIRVTGQESSPGMRPTVLGRSVRRPSIPESLTSCCSPAALPI